MTTDLLIKCDEDSGLYDMSLDENGDFAHGDFFDTSLLYSLLGERRATESEVPISENRGGWIGNEGKSFENGSKIWLFYQSRLSRTVMNGLADAAYNGLVWLIEDGLVLDIEVNTVLSNGLIRLRINIERFESQVETRYFDLWENTGVSNAS